jgi:hypothetical protein
LLGVFGSENDEAGDWLATGQALSAMLLTARSKGVWAAFLNQPVEVAELRSLLRDTIGVRGYPQLVLRMGYAPAVRPTPRRPVPEVLS